MFGLGRLGKLGSVGRALAAWTPAQLWPLGATSPGCWIDPPYVASLYQDSTGTTAISAIGTVLDTSNPVGLALDRKGNLELGPELVITPYAGAVTGGWGFSGNTITRDGVTAGGVATLNITNHTVTARCKITFDVAGLSGDAFSMLSGTGNVGEISTNGSKSYYFDTLSTVTLRFIAWGGGAGTVTISNISVKEIPGIHLSQATATSRPVASARSNWLLETEDLTDVAWGKYNTAITTGHLSPSGQPDAFKIIPGVGYNVNGASIYQVSSTWVGSSQVIRAKADGFDWICFIDATGSAVAAYFDLANGVVGTVRPNYGASITSLGNGWYECEIISLVAAQTYYQLNCTDSDGVVASTGDGVKGVLFWHPQDGVLGATYQAVNTDSDYDASAGPTYCDLDGTDDGWLSATFTADTDFTDGMDALIAIRRDSTANAVCGLYQSVAEANKVFGIAESGSGSGCVGSGAGTPTVLVDGTQLTGGTAVTRGTLHTALTPGAWHILEFRNLDLSTWTAVGFGLYTSYVLNGALGGHKVFSNGQDANRDLARAQMAAYFGVTLP